MKMKDDLISKTSVCEIIADIYPTDGEKVVAVKEIDKAYEAIQQLPSAQPEIIHCRDCEHQIQYFYEDKRRKDGGYYIYGCELPNDYSHICFDDDFCSRAERKEE